MRKLKRDKCVVLPLVLKRKWYDMIECGEKKIEYRRANYWLFRVYRWYRRCIDSIDVYRTKHLLNFSGYIDGHKIVEIEPLDKEHCAVKTIGWGER